MDKRSLMAQLQDMADWIGSGNAGVVREPDPDYLASIAKQVGALERVARAAANDALGGQATCGPRNPYWGAWRELQDAITAFKESTDA